MKLNLRCDYPDELRKDSSTNNLIVFVAFCASSTDSAHNFNLKLIQISRVDIMSIIKLSSSLFAIVAVAFISSQNDFASAFTPALSPLSTAASTGSRMQGFSALRMAEEELDGVQITSARKELKFDDRTGRFFETNIDLEECIPEEEFCTVDEDTGNKIRLTMAEKERIFLDALQVRTSYIYIYYIHYCIGFMN